MKFTDLFIKKPVLAIVVSLLILVLGLSAFICAVCGESVAPVGLCSAEFVM